MDRPLAPRLITRDRTVAAIVAVAVLAVAAFAWFRYGAQRTVAATPNRLTISAVSFDRFREYIPVTGNIVPRTTVYLDAIEGGQVTAVNAEAGQIVAAGDAILTLKNTNLQLEVIGREAQLTEQLNNLSTTTLAFEQNRLRHRRELIEIDFQIDRLNREISRLTPLIASGGITHAELDDLEAERDYRRALRDAVEDAQAIDAQSQATQIDTLREAVSAMNRNLSIARENLDNLIVTAPITGQLTVFEANVGESKAPGERIGQIDEMGAFRISAFVDEFYLTRVRIGQTATVRIDGQTHTLEVAKVYPDVRNRQFEVDLKFASATPASVRRGQTVRMRLEIGEPADSLVLTNGRFFEETGGTWVFVLDPSGDHAERRNVRLGRRNPDGIEVLEGLREGEHVITSSYERFMDADRVQFREAAGNEAAGEAVRSQ